MQPWRRLILLSIGLTFLLILSWVQFSGSVNPFAIIQNPTRSQQSPGDSDLDYDNDSTFTIDDVQPPKLELDDNVEHWNMHQLSEMYACAAGNGTRPCHPNREKIILLASGDTKFGLWYGWRRGESIWGEAMFREFYDLGYTVLVTEGWVEAPFLYKLYGPQIQIVVGERPGKCIYNPQCVKSTENPDGIPVWKIFDMNYFPKLDWFGTPTDATPLGGPWIATAVDNGPDYPYQYIGYSIEESCLAQTPLPASQRENRVYILMKELAFAHFATAWEPSYYARAATDLGIKFVAGYGDDPKFKPGGQDRPVGGWKDIEEPGKVDNLGGMGREDFLRELGKSRLLLGVGMPNWSPSPYDALCLGVPFLNPVRYFDQSDPDNQTKWETQHPEITRLGPGPPYVYTVHARDYEGFVAAIKKALATPIERYIAPHMKREAFRQRLINWAETDWKAKAEELDQVGWRKKAVDLHREKGETLNIDFVF
ncbi:hypothetical protein DFP72DRAFT_885447 [Ephemerocybe angulata]|uniref:Glycosyltransferase family 18 catalytic domain-containing protein n=1 Tax=Ephemerocybe angulata TaxID=980116 RepID=A0A8H6I614_9AGAR|nr:hypothetical protein DFP72DRAFT_885447 [Tulosesus angulatus]